MIQAVEGEAADRVSVSRYPGIQSLALSTSNQDWYELKPDPEPAPKKTFKYHWERFKDGFR